MDLKSGLTTIVERLKQKLRPRPNSDLLAEILNYIAPPIYVYTITSIWICGVIEILPYFYKEERTLFLHRSFGTLVFFEMMSNWYFLRTTDNSYVPWTSGDTGPPNQEYWNAKTNPFNLPDVTSFEPKSTSILQSVVVETGSDARAAEKRIVANGNGLIPNPVSAPRPKKASYWSWQPCIQCKFIKPPRCHHCPMCEKCILKRDHHCFFANNCIGFYNQRHFIVFCAWAGFGCTYASLHYLYYIYDVIWPMMSFLDIFAPFALFRFIIGYSSLFVTNLMLSTTFLILFVPMSSGFFFEHMKLVARGVTSFELNNLNTGKLMLTDVRPFSDKMRSVFGDYWPLSFIFPVHVWFPPAENPYTWPEIKVFRSA